METRLRVGRAIAKTEEEVAPELMKQVKRHAPEDPPPAMSTDGKGAYREAMLGTWGAVPQYGGRGRPPTVPKPGKDWQYLQVIKRREGSKVVSVTTKVIYGDQEEVKKVLGEQTAYVERTHLTSRQMNGRLVRKTLSFSKELRFLKAASTLLRCALQLYSSPEARYVLKERHLQNTCVGNNAHLLWLLSSRITFGRLKSF